MGFFDILKPKAQATTLVQQRPQKVLIADDDQLFRTYCHDLLVKNSYEVSLATNGKEAVAGALANPPDVIVLDIVMPEMDGKAALKQLRENPTTQAIPVIMLTSAASITNMEETKLHAASRFLNKSTVTPEEILTTVRDLLSEKPKNNIIATLKDQA